MNELGRRTKVLSAIALCILMITSMLVLLPSKATAAPNDGWIQGIVTDGAMNPIEHAYMIYILNMMGGGSPVASTWTDASGLYNFTVPGGFDYMVLAFHGNYFSANGTTSVLPGEQSDLDFVMTPIAPLVTDVTLKGWVKDSDGIPVTIGTVIGVVNDPSNMGQGPPLYANSTMADSSGWYSLNVIPGSVGGGAALFDVPGYPMIDNTTHNPLVSGMTYWFNLTLRNVVSTDDAVIRGNVTDADTDLPLENILVYYESSNQWNEQMGYSNYTFTDAFGHYKMNVTNGSAQIMFSTTGYSMFRVGGMTVHAGDRVRIDAQLFPITATVMGNVTDLSMTPIANARVYLFDDSMNNLTFATTNGAGQYILDAFSGTNLVLAAQADGYGMSWATVDVNPGDVIWHNFVLTPFDAWLTGKVTNKVNGFPIENANVWAHSSIFSASSQTNSTGDYNVSLVSGTTYTVDVDAMGYGHNSSEVAVATGENVYNVELMPLDAWMTGKVTDKLSGSPIENASVWVHSSVFENWNATDSSGDYNVTLVSGTTYTVDVDAMGYRHNTSELAVVSGENLYDVQLLPNVLPQTTKLYGWVNDSSSLSGIANAQVQVGLPPPDYGGQNQTMTDGTGYYEMWVSPVELMYVASARDHVHAQGMIDATGQIQLRLNVSLDPDIWGPNVTYFDHSPTLNISWTNPSYVHAVVQEQDPSQFVLAYAIYDHSTGIHAYFYVVQMLYDSFNPLNYASNNLPYTQAGDVYTIDYNWIGTAHGGLLTNMTDQEYLGSYEISMGLQVYDAIRGYYINSTLGGWMSGTAWFDRSTGDFAWFQFDSSMPWADPSDLTGVFRPSVSMIEVDETNGNTNWFSDWPMGDWSVVGLKFAYDELLPSGRYVSQFFVSDFGQRGWGQLTNLTADNDPPVADAGPDQSFLGGQLVELNGSLSSDNIGIVNWTWTFTYDGTDYTLWGPVVDFGFMTDGTYDVTLTVTDGAGHTASDTVQITIGSVIPEFPTLVLPVMGMLALSVVVFARRRRTDE